MEPWQTLGIMPTEDKGAIKSAYLQKKADPLSDQKALAVAFEEALRLASDPEKVADAIFSSKTYREEAILAATFSNDGPSQAKRKVLNVLHYISVAFLATVIFGSYLITKGNMRKILRGDRATPQNEVLLKPSDEQLQSLPVQAQLRYGITFRNTQWVINAINLGADVNASHKGKPFFKMAVETDFPRIIDAFLHGKPDPNTLDESHGNALHWAIPKGNPLVIKKLLGYGIDPLHEDDNGTTPIEMAHNYNYTSLTKLLKENK